MPNFSIIKGYLYFHKNAFYNTVNVFFYLKKISLDELPSPILEIQNDLSQFLHNMSNLLLYWTFSGILLDVH